MSKIKKMVSFLLVMAMFATCSVSVFAATYYIDAMQISGWFYMFSYVNDTGVGADSIENMPNTLLNVHPTGGGVGEDSPYFTLTQDTDPIYNNDIFFYFRDLLFEGEGSCFTKEHVYKLEFDYKLEGTPDGAYAFVDFLHIKYRQNLVDQPGYQSGVWKHFEIEANVTSDITEGIGADSIKKDVPNALFLSTFFSGNNGAGKTPMSLSMANFSVKERDGEGNYNGPNLMPNGNSHHFPNGFSTPVRGTVIPSDATVANDASFTAEYVDGEGNLKLSWTTPLYDTGTQSDWPATANYQQFNIYDRATGSLIKSINSKSGSTNWATDLDGYYFLEGYEDGAPYDFLVKTADMYGNESSPGVVVSNVPSLDNFKFVNGSGDVTGDTIPTGTISASVDVTNESGSAYDFHMITALYVDDVLVKVSVEPQSVDTTETVTCDIEIEASDVAGQGSTAECILKGFIWSDLGGMISPLSSINPIEVGKKN